MKLLPLSPTDARKVRSKSDQQTQGGAALIIVLAFIVILTGLVVAFFSRSIITRQMASASANRIRVDLFADGAVDTVLSDLKQEIVAGSTASGTAPSIVYVPKTPADVMPVIAGKKNPAGTLHPNLLKQSAAQQAFYPKGPIRAAGPSSQSVTTVASLNGRAITPARWNTPLLMEKKTLTSYTDFTPIDTTSSAFVPPDWVLVARDGSNPTAWSTSIRDAALSNKSFVVGRYAYNIYHEGGLLDLNAAGYPAKDSGGNAVITAAQAAYKDSGLPFADLKQLPGIAQLTAARQDQVTTAIASWRNFTSLKPSAGATWYQITFGNPAQSGLDFLTFLRSSDGGFLVPSTRTPMFGKQSDKFFTSRQEMIQFVTQGLTTDKSGKEQADLQNALPYLTHFTRDLNQPSYVRAQSVDTAAMGYDASAPKIQSDQQGGNNQVGLDPYVNPGFPSVRAKGAFTRNDGSKAVMTPVPEALVKQRFALNRLAWLTYKGPSALRTQSDPDMQSLINTNGVPLTLLQQGTAANIQKYFGLNWVADKGSQLGKWQYNVHNGNSGTGPTGPILRLGAPGDTGPNIAALGASAHEPDFFELLKASVNAGSKAKTSTKWGRTTSSTDLQAQSDLSFDYAIMQLGANIIAQSKVDGFGVRIGFDDGVAREFYGVENNPYFYRARWGILKIRNENPVITGSVPVPNAPPFPAPGSVAADPRGTWGASQGLLKDPGVVMLMLVPEVWNPHDQNAPIPATTLRPTTFRIVADSATDFGSLASGTATYTQVSATGVDDSGAGTHNSVANAELRGSGGQPAFSRAKGGTGLEIYQSYKGYPHALVPANTAMTFTVPQPATFREPTLLARYNVPAGSNLKIDSTGWNPATYPETADYTNLETSTGNSFTANQGFTADCNNPLTLPASVPVPNKTTQYVGIPVGFFPVEWVGSRIANQGPSSVRNIFRSDRVNPVASPDITIRMQYQDPTNAANWITYDTKYIKPGTSWLHSMLGSSSVGGMMQAAPVWAGYTDPRTNRFGAIVPVPPSGSSNAARYSGPGAAAFVGSSFNGKSETTPANAAEWLDASNDVLISDRPTADAGYYFSATGTKTMTNQEPGWASDSMVLGLLSQNTLTSTSNGKRYSGSFGTDPNTGPSDVNYYADADNVVRRAMGAFNTSYSGTNNTVGLPLVATNVGATQSQSRPWMLHRPFRSVAELGYVFSGTPWKNIDFFTPESGDTALLDAFCVNDTSDSNALIAGKVNLNTRQIPVLNAILTNAYSDEKTAATGTISATTANAVSTALVARTKGTGALLNVGDLVGKWVAGASNSPPIDGSASTNYDGLSGRDLAAAYGGNVSMTNIQRFREAAIRPLASAGMTRTWNLMIDVIAQTGRYPVSATGVDKFVVEGEQRYWVHVAIDRFTGQVIDKQVEVVTE